MTVTSDVVGRTGRWKTAKETRIEREKKTQVYPAGSEETNDGVAARFVVCLRESEWNTTQHQHTNKRDR